VQIDPKLTRGRDALIKRNILGMLGNGCSWPNASRHHPQVEFLDIKISVLRQSYFDRPAVLNNCVGFIDCTKIQMERQGRRGSNQRANYSGHKRFHCFCSRLLRCLMVSCYQFLGLKMGGDMTLHFIQKAVWIRNFPTAYLLMVCNTVYTVILLTSQGHIGRLASQLSMPRWSKKLTTCR
jgi:hypothetical protein